MRYFSMFTGVGGFELGVNKAYENNQAREHLSEWRTSRNDSKSNRFKPNNSVRKTRRDSEYADCVGFSEVDKYCNQLLSIKWPTVKNYGDATKINTTELPDFDLLVGGFPCQSFSIAGKRRGFDDTRGTLFFDVARILRDKKPRNVVLENVKGLLSHDGGRTFTTIIRVLSDLGYFVEWQVLNSKNFGVPQNRERVFIIGHLGGEPARKVFPIRQSDELSQKSRGKGQIENKYSTAITTDYRKGVHSGGETYAIGTLRTHKDGQGFRAIKQNISPTIPARAREDGSGQPVISKTVRTGGMGSPYGSKQNWDSYELEGKIRRLTPLETERLQGFPDNWTKDFSDSQRYKMMGNAVTVNVVAEVIKRLFTN